MDASSGRYVELTKDLIQGSFRNLAVERESLLLLGKNIRVRRKSQHRLRAKPKLNLYSSLNETVTRQRLCTMNQGWTPRGKRKQNRILKTMFCTVKEKSSFKINLKKNLTKTPADTGWRAISLQPLKGRNQTPVVTTMSDQLAYSF